MADALDYSENTDPQDSDALYFIDDSAGTPADEYILYSTLCKNISILGLLERSSDPSEPAEGTAYIWMSDGTGKGDDGDVMIASQAGGNTYYATLFDHSTGAAW
jgi:hypothetical protein